MQLEIVSLRGVTQVEASLSGVPPCKALLSRLKPRIASPSEAPSPCFEALGHASQPGGALTSFDCCMEPTMEGGSRGGSEAGEKGAAECGDPTGGSSDLAPIIQAGSAGGVLGGKDAHRESLTPEGDGGVVFLLGMAAARDSLTEGVHWGVVGAAPASVSTSIGGAAKSSDKLSAFSLITAVSPGLRLVLAAGVVGSMECGRPSGSSA